jgi:microcystin-dependent protein
MATTPNKGYELIVTGTEVDTWGDKLNTDVFTVIDTNLGGVVTKSLTNVQVDLDADESENLRLILNGTLTGNVLVTTLAIGMTIIENNCTGNFTVTFQKNGVGTPVTIPNGTKALVVTGASGDPGIVGNDFPAGTRLLFQQTTPPAGWSKDTTPGLDNSAVRVVIGTASNGGSLDFTTAMADRALSGTVQGTTLSESQIPSHHHLNVANVSVSTTAMPTANEYIARKNDLGTDTDIGGTGTVATGARTTSTGGGQSHAHGLTMTNLDMRVKYYDYVVGQKQ